MNSDLDSELKEHTSSVGWKQILTVLTNFQEVIKFNRNKSKFAGNTIKNFSLLLEL